MEEIILAQGKVTLVDDDNGCDCGVDTGEMHVLGCDNEDCPLCGGQLLMCLAMGGCDGHTDSEARWERRMLRARKPKAANWRDNC